MPLFCFVYRWATRYQRSTLRDAGIDPEEFAMAAYERCRRIVADAPDRFSPDVPNEPYFARVLMSLFLDRVRSREYRDGKRTVGEDDLTPEAWEAAVADGRAEESLERRFLWATLAPHIESLSPKQREALLWFFFDSDTDALLRDHPEEYRRRMSRKDHALAALRARLR